MVSRASCVFLVLALVTAMAACSDETDPAAGNDPTPDMTADMNPAPNPDPNPTPNPSPNPDPVPNPDMNPAPTPDMNPDPAPDGPVESCDEAGAAECFSNSDCDNPAERCENLGAEGADEVPCCTPGERGTNQPGDACTQAADCENGVCIEGDDFQGCSQECVLPSDCPEGMQRCIEITGIGGWCFPGDPPALCSEINREGCFSNLDCEDNERCEDVVGDDLFPLACCIEGARGAGVGGDPCTLAEECDTGLCIEGDNVQVCSQECDENAPEDCPEGMQICIPAFGGEGAFCYPED